MNDIKDRQKNIQIVYDEIKITPDQIEHIQHLKAGVHPKNLPYKEKGCQTYEEYERLLEKLSSYVVVRGEVKQMYLMDENATVLCDEPYKDNQSRATRERVLYYATFPKL